MRALFVSWCRSLSVALLGVLVPVGANAAEPAASMETLERALAEAPDPLILLRLAALNVEAGRCDDGLTYYERFFAACSKCDALTLGVKRFEETVERCQVTIDRESEVRGLARVPRSKEPLRSPADASLKEVTRLLDEARSIDEQRAVRALLTLGEAGENASVRLLNELRDVAFAILSERNASQEQVESFLQRLKTVNLGRYEELKQALATASQASDLNRVRREAMDSLVAGSVGGREARITAVGCRPNDELEWGQITVSSSPWSEAYLNGEKLGSTPVHRADALVGCVTLRLVDPQSGKSVLQNVTVRSNKIAVVQVDLESGRGFVRYE